MRIGAREALNSKMLVRSHNEIAVSDAGSFAIAGES